MTRPEHQDDSASTPTSAGPQLPAAELQTVVDNTPAAVWSCLPDGSADFLNQRWLTFLNLSPDAAKGVGWANLLHPDDLDGHMKRWFESVRSENGFEYESRFRRYDGVYAGFSRAPSQSGTTPAGSCDGAAPTWILKNASWRRMPYAEVSGIWPKHNASARRGVSAGLPP